MSDQAVNTIIQTVEYAVVGYGLGIILVAGVFWVFRKKIFKLLEKGF